jgi:cellulose synthase/poly-beta-1,6-N-acetylglucosamine synthase-like glycosyltransferase
MLSVLFGLATLGISYFAIYELWMVVSFYRESREADPKKRSAGKIAKARNSPPRVLVQLPVYNEPEVVQQLIAQVARLNYPRSALRIQILDDSDDQTTDFIAGALAGLTREKAALFSHVRRSSREGFKAGALAHGMSLEDSDFIAIFDADFLPPENFLDLTVFESTAFDDPDVGFVQGRWTFYNRDESVFTQVQSILIDRHFLVQKPFQQAAGEDIIFNGSGGIWRREAIVESGGWLSRTLCEDLDLSMRLVLKGKKGVYDPQLECPNEIPANLQAFKLQQRRWAKGTAQTMRFLLPSVVGRGSFAARANNFFAVAGYLVHPLLLFYAISWPLLVLGGTNIVYLWCCQVALILGNIAAISGLVTAHRLHSKDASKSDIFVQVGISMGLGVSLMVNNTIAFLSGMFDNGGTFARTPKVGRIGKGGTQSKLFSLHWSFLFEGALAIYALAAAALMLSRGFVMEFQQTFVFGLVMMGLVLIQLFSTLRPVLSAKKAPGTV